MTISAAPTAELPTVRPLRGITVAPTEIVLGIPPDASVTAVVEDLARPCRADIRAGRRLARQYRRRHAAFGVAVLLGTLGATVAVLDVLH